jgi:hypothetical protein
MSGADITLLNHGPDAIVSVQVNGYGGPRANSYGKTAASTASPPGKIRICFIIDVSLQN